MVSDKQKLHCLCFPRQDCTSVVNLGQKVRLKSFSLSVHTDTLSRGRALKQALPAIPTSVSVNEKYSIIVGFKEGIMAFDIRKGRLSDYPSRGVQRLAFMPVKVRFNLNLNIFEKLI